MSMVNDSEQVPIYAIHTLLGAEMRLEFQVGTTSGCYMLETVRSRTKLD